MQNLAGHRGADSLVRAELTLAGIPIVEDPSCLKDEVSTSATGLLQTADGDTIQFERAWYYWRAQGPVALDIAADLYEDPIGRVAVRAGGHAGGTPPDEHISCKVGERDVMPESTRPDFERFNLNLNKYVFAPTDEAGLVEWTKANGGRVFVQSYHIDSAEGLALFVRALLRQPKAADRG